MLHDASCQRLAACATDPSGLQSDVFRTALKFRLSSEPFRVQLLLMKARCAVRRWTSSGITHLAAATVLRLCNNIRDILGHAARGAGLAAVVIEKKNQIGSNAKPGDITV